MTTILNNGFLNDIVLQNATMIQINDIILSDYFDSYDKKRNISLTLFKKQKQEKIILANKILKQIIKKDLNKQFSINKNITLITILNLLRS